MSMLRVVEVAHSFLDVILKFHAPIATIGKVMAMMKIRITKQHWRMS